MLIKRIKKSGNVDGKNFEHTMWGLFSMDEIPAGAYVMQYVGEVLKAKDGDHRGFVYD